MPHRLLHIGGVFPSFPKTPMVDAALNAIGDEWIRYASNSWIIWTARSAAELFAMIKPAFGLDDQVFIVELNAKERGGWLSAWIWQWIDAKIKGQDETLGDLLSKLYPSQNALHEGLGAGQKNDLFGGLGALARLLDNKKPK